MCDDEKQIRELVTNWLAATKAGDLQAVTRLMSDDVLFITPGREPFGKEQFVADSRGMAGMQFEGSSEILEVHVAGDWAWMRSRLRIEMTPPGKPLMRLSGDVLSILRKENGRWVLLRDANFVK